MQFILLGTGTSAGVPVIACDCPTCTSTDPRDRRLRSGAALRYADSRGSERILLIDATPDLRQQALTHDLRRCDAILFTHNHVDHTFGLDEVRRFNAAMNAPIDIFADDHTMADLRRIYQHVFEPHRNVNKSFIASLIPNRLTPAQPVSLHGLRITPIPLLHGRLPILGFRFDPLPGQSDPDGLLPLAYCTDVSGIPPESWRLLEGLNHLVLDGLRFRAHPTHFTIDQAVSAAEQIGAGHTWLTHIAHEVLHAEVDPQLPEGVSLAFDGLTLPLSTP